MVQGSKDSLDKALADLQRKSEAQALAAVSNTSHASANKSVQYLGMSKSDESAETNQATP